MKNLIKANNLIVTVVAAIVFVSGMGAVKADSTGVVNTVCNTVTSLYGGTTTCDTEETGFISAEIIAIAVAAFGTGVTSLLVKNYTDLQLKDLI